jgi:hypothetical protein
MTTLIRLNLALAIVFLTAAVAVPLIYERAYPELLLLQGNAEFRRSVEAINDIEHLRKVLYTVVVGTDKTVVATREFADVSVRLLAAIACVAAAGFAGTCIWLYLLQRRSGQQ